MDHKITKKMSNFKEFTLIFCFKKGSRLIVFMTLPKYLLSPVGYFNGCQWFRLEITYWVELHQYNALLLITNAFYL